ncbi:MAG: response regulator [Bacteroidales bacterium]|nr:response regulator [Bacteroidales bacterium]
MNDGFTYTAAVIPMAIHWDTVTVIVAGIVIILLTVFIAILQRKRQTAEKALRKKEELIQQLLESRQLPPAQNDNSKADLILLVDEDMEMSDMLEMSLSSEYRIIRVSNGNEALTIAQEVNPDIIISDVVIPGIQGDELCRILKSSVATSHIPVILLTAKSAREAIVHGLEAGASDYIIKPFDMLVLKARIRNILKRRDSLRKDILHVDPQSEEGGYASQMDKEFLNKVINILNEELASSEFSVDDLCRRLGVSRTVLYNKIKTLTGQPPSDFIKVVRLNKAKEILETHKYMISEVADMVGFSDPKYFSVCYKKQFGISPSKV